MAVNGGSFALVGDVCSSVKTTADYLFKVEIYLPKFNIENPLNLLIGSLLPLVLPPSAPLAPNCSVSGSGVKHRVSLKI